VYITFQGFGREAKPHSFGEDGVIGAGAAPYLRGAGENSPL